MFDGNHCEHRISSFLLTRSQSTEDKITIYQRGIQYLFNKENTKNGFFSIKEIQALDCKIDLLQHTQ